MRRGGLRTPVGHRFEVVRISCEENLNMTGPRSWSVGTFRRATLAGLALAAFPALAAAQATVTGKVSASGQPLVEARVLVRGTSLTTSTNSQGVYTIRNVPVGTQTIEVLRVGYRAQ